MWGGWRESGRGETGSAHNLFGYGCGPEEGSFRLSVKREKVESQNPLELDFRRRGGARSGGMSKI